jgi:hypothetical protein
MAPCLHTHREYVGPSTFEFVGCQACRRPSRSFETRVVRCLDCGAVFTERVECRG